MGKVVVLKDYKAKLAGALSTIKWEEYFDGLNQESLMEEMMKFNTDRRNAGGLTLPLIERGLPLFSKLAVTVKIPSIRDLCSHYHEHLKHEHAAMNGPKGA